MGLFNDTVTIYKKNSGSWTRTVVAGVQWSDVTDKVLTNGRLTATKSGKITFPEATFGVLPDLLNFGSEDAIFKGTLTDAVTDTAGQRLSDLIKAHPQSGIIRSVNDNSNRDHLRNIKVVVY